MLAGRRVSTDVYKVAKQVVDKGSDVLKSASKSVVTELAGKDMTFGDMAEEVIKELKNPDSNESAKAQSLTEALLKEAVSSASPAIRGVFMGRYNNGAYRREMQNGWSPELPCPTLRGMRAPTRPARHTGFVPIQRGVERVSARSNRLLWFGFRQCSLFPVLLRKLSQERRADNGRSSVMLSLDAGNHDKSTGSFGQEDTDSSYKHVMSKGLPLTKQPQWRLMLLTSLNGSSQAGADFFVFGVGGRKGSVFLEKKQ